MHWIAPSEKNTATDILEKRFRAAADQFLAHCSLNAEHELRNQFIEAGPARALSN